MSCKCSQKKKKKKKHGTFMQWNITQQGHRMNY